MSVIVAGPFPSTLIELSSAVGVTPYMVISFAPGLNLKSVEVYYKFGKSQLTLRVISSISRII